MTALFESMRVRYSSIPFLARHVARMERAAVAIGLPAPPRDTAQAVLRRSVAEQEAAVRAAWDGAVLEVQIRPLSDARSLTLVTAREVHPGYPWKRVERAAFDRAIAEAEQAGADEAVFLDGAGHVAEAARFSVGWLDGDTIVFPPLEMGVLASIARARAIELAVDLGLHVGEARVPLAALAGRPVFLANAVRGILPVTALDGVPVPPDSRIGTLAGLFWP